MSRTIIEVPLDRISLDPELYPRSTLDEDRVLEFAELLRGPRTVWKLPPVEVVRSWDRSYLFTLADGWHRVHAYRYESRDSIPAVVVPAADPLLHAVRKSSAVSLPLTLAEKVAVARRLIATHPYMSDEEIARHLRMNPRVIAQLRRGGKVRH